MKILDPGHLYELDQLDIDTTKPPFTGLLRFVKRDGHGYPGNVGRSQGTIIQDVLRCCIDRLKYLDQQIPHDYNRACIESLRSAIFLLETRAASRHGRNIMDPIRTFEEIESLETSPKNGHLMYWQEEK